MCGVVFPTWVPANTTKSGLSSLLSQQSHVGIKGCSLAEAHISQCRHLWLGLKNALENWLLACKLQGEAIKMKT